MNKISALSLISFLMLSSTALSDDKVIAKYQGKEVKESEVTTKLKEAFNGELPGGKKDFKELDKDTKTNLVKAIITGDLIEQEAHKAKLESSEEYNNLINNLKKQVLQKMFIEKKIKELVSEKDIKAKYDEYVKSIANKEEVQAKHILVETEKEAKDILKKLKKKGTNFDEIAKQSSKDKSVDLGYFSEGQMVPEFEKAAFAMKPGTISEPVKTSFGWHIIKLEDKRKITPQTYEVMKPKLEREVSAKVAQDYIDKVQKDAAIELFVD
jgi:peptidyl-prolyl cis-trans isomerase C